MAGSCAGPAAVISSHPAAATPDGGADGAARRRPGRSRPVPPVDREESLIPEIEPGLGPDELVREPDPAKFRDRMSHPGAGADARRSVRGGESGKARARRPRPGPRARASGTRTSCAGRVRARASAIPRRPSGGPTLKVGARRRRPSPRAIGTETGNGPKPHDRAGEPGYVPRRARLQSGEPAFGADVFPPAAEWPERDPEHLIEAEGDPRLADLADDDEPSLFGDEGGAGTADAARPEGRRRRRRRGRRRERPKTDPAGRHRRDGWSPILTISPRKSARRDRLPAAAPPSTTTSAIWMISISKRLEAPGGNRSKATSSAATSSPSVPAAPVEEEIDLELEQEIRREIEEIEELEREMGLRGPADARPRRGEEPARGGRSSRGRGLVKPPIQEIFRRGDEVLVQVIKESIGTKGPTLSTYISIPGRYLVLMPGLNRVGVSRKIVDEGQRRKLREIMHELNPPKGLGFIVRTAGLERTKRELARDLAYLLRLWKVILRRIKKTKAPTPIYQESDMIIRTIRDIFNSEIDTIWIDEPSAFERAQDFLKVVMPRFVNRLKLYDEKVPLFHKYGIEDEIAKIQRRHVPLPGRGLDRDRPDRGPGGHRRQLGQFPG